MAKPRKTDFFETSPWSALRRSDKAVIEGYVDAARQWERIAEIAPSAHIDDRAAADFIVRAVTDHPIHRALIRQLIDALEICLESEGITWEAEHDAGIAVARARKIACL